MTRNAWAFFAFVFLGIVAVFYGNLVFARRSSGGADFLGHWVVMREFIFHGKSPYSEASAVKAQHAVFGRAAFRGEKEYREVLPLYISLVTFAPFALIGNFTVARALWMTLLEFALLVSTLLLWKVLHWRPKGTLGVAVIFFGLTWYFAANAIIDGNAVVLSLFWLAVTLYALWADAEGWAGAALVFATVKLGILAFPTLFLLLWTASRRRWRFWKGFFITFAVLFGFSIWLLPHWLLEDLRNVLAHSAYAPPASPQAVLAHTMPGIGAKIGWALVAISWVLMLLEWAAAWRRPFHHALWTVSATVLFGIWSGIRTAPSDQLLLWIALLVVWALWDMRWKPSGVWAVWVTLVGLWIGIWAFALVTVAHNAFGKAVQSPWLYFPLGVFLFVGLYWVRWWAVRPPLLVEMLSQE